MELRPLGWNNHFACRLIRDRFEKRNWFKVVKKRGDLWFTLTNFTPDGNKNLKHSKHSNNPAKFRICNRFQYYFWYFHWSLNIYIFLNSTMQQPIILTRVRNYGIFTHGGGGGKGWQIVCSSAGGGVVFLKWSRQTRNYEYYFFNWAPVWFGNRITMLTIRCTTVLPQFVVLKNCRPSSAVVRLATIPIMLRTNLVSSVSAIGVFLW